MRRRRVKRGKTTLLSLLDREERRAFLQEQLDQAAIFRQIACAKNGVPGPVHRNVIAPDEDTGTAPEDSGSPDAQTASLFSRVLRSVVWKGAIRAALLAAGISVPAGAGIAWWLLSDVAPAVVHSSGGPQQEQAASPKEKAPPAPPANRPKVLETEEEVLDFLNRNLAPQPLQQQEKALDIQLEGEVESR